MPEFREFGRSMLVTADADLKQRMLSMVQDTAEERYNLLIQSSPDIVKMRHSNTLPLTLASPALLSAGSGKKFLNERPLVAKWPFNAGCCGSPLQAN